MSWRVLLNLTPPDVVFWEVATWILAAALKLLQMQISHCFDKNSDLDPASGYSDVFHDTCEHGFEIKTPTGQIAKMYFELPQQLDEIVTLHPCPFEVEDGHFQQIVTKYTWGSLKKLTYGKIKNISRTKNEYTNLHMHDLNYQNMKPQIEAFGHVIGATRHFEAHLPLCNYYNPKKIPPLQANWPQLHELPKHKPTWPSQSTISVEDRVFPKEIKLSKVQLRIKYHYSK